MRRVAAAVLLALMVASPVMAGGFPTVNGTPAHLAVVSYSANNKNTIIRHTCVQASAWSTNSGGVVLYNPVEVQSALLAVGQTIVLDSPSWDTARYTRCTGVDANSGSKITRAAIFDILPG